MEFAYWLAQHCEDVWTALDVSRPDSGRDQQEPQPKRTRASAPVARPTDGEPDVRRIQNIEDFLAALGRSPLPNKKCQDFLLCDHAFESWRSFLQQHASSESHRCDGASGLFSLCYQQSASGCGTQSRSCDWNSIAAWRRHAAPIPLSPFQQPHG